MLFDMRKLWAERVAQAWINLESDDPTQEDTTVIKIDQHIKALEAKIAENYHKNDIETTRGLTRQQVEDIAGLQIIEGKIYE